MTRSDDFHRYNGYLPPGDRGRRRSKFILYKRPVPNGVKRSKHYIVKTPHSSQAILNTKQHSISYTLSRTQAVIVEYTEDEKTDMFQVNPKYSILQFAQLFLVYLLIFFYQINAFIICGRIHMERSRLIESKSVK